MPGARSIGLFGGTFDPVHLGHLHLAALAREALALDEVRFLPCRISPHKSGREPGSATHRVAMLRLATAGLPWARVDERELERAGPSFSWQTAAELAAELPEARLFWIMGGDQWDALPQWRHPERLAACVEFAVLARGAAPQPRPGYRLHVIRGDHPASATAVREAAASLQAAHEWLHPDVAGWIRQHGLYRSDSRPKPR